MNYDNDPGTNGYPDVNPGIAPGNKFKMLGQTGSSSSNSVANQGCGWVALGQLAAATRGTVTITDSLITTASGIEVTPYGKGDTTGVVAAWVQSVAAGSAVIGYYAIAAMTAAWDLWYSVTN